MILESVRLKNIKSYGEGPEGRGITVAFAPGVNRVAGRNGHGKSTLIEAIGFALFLAKPEFEENFHFETYFLSHGAKAGEIDVTFRCEGQAYRVERGIGTSPRRSKVVELPGEIVCAEDDQEVATLVCRLLGVPHPDPLREIFIKLVGVKQGRLTWPFDSKSAHAKAYFEPLFQVEVFRECFDRLKGTADAFSAQRQAQEVHRAGIEQRLRERADCRELQEAARNRVAATRGELARTQEARASAQTSKESWETAEREAAEAVSARDRALQVRDHSAALREGSEREVREGEHAEATCQATAEAHRIHLAALQALQALEAQREQRDRLREERQRVEHDRVQRQGRANGARDQAATFSHQAAERRRESSLLESGLEAQRQALDASAAAFQATEQQATRARGHRDRLSEAVTRWRNLAETQETHAGEVARIQAEVSGWDASRLTSAETQEQDALRTLESAQRALTEAQQRERTLREQLAQIGQGICPFLRETCRQFDPARVQADLEKESGRLPVLRVALADAKEIHQGAVQARKTLGEAKARFTTQEQVLAQVLRRYLEAAAAFRTAEAQGWLEDLLAWEPSLPALPLLPETPQAPLMAADVARLQPGYRSFGEAVDVWWGRVDELLQRRQEDQATRAQERVKQQVTLEQGTRRWRSMIEDATRLETQAREKEKEAADHAREVEVCTRRRADLDVALRAFADLDDRFKAEQARRDSTRTGHEQYLGAAKLAADLTQRRARLGERQAAEQAARQAWESADAKARALQQAFDPRLSAEARATFQRLHDRVIALNETLTADLKQLAEQDRRHAEWLAARRDMVRVEADIGRSEAALAITEVARRTLRDAAPAVAQHLCSRIAVRAQVLFNRIHPEPVGLAWGAKQYSLRVTPGDRHFAMLSGGEQTKLALALTLSMIEEFSRLRFCVFDEPTYGVDADSRRKLADAILEAQAAAGLEQLLLVSHDDAFEGKIEHAILLDKTASEGTREVGLG